MWKSIGERFLELYQLHESEEKIDLHTFSRLDVPKVTKSFKVYITYEGVKAFSIIRPKIADGSLYFEVKIFIDAAIITNKHYVTELRLAEENRESEILYDEILAFNKENFVNFLLEKKDFQKLKQFLEVV